MTSPKSHKVHKTPHLLSRVLRRLWNLDTLFALVLIATGTIFTLLWYWDIVRPVVLVPIGGALATLLGAIPGIVSPKTKGRVKVTSAVLAGAFVGLGTWYTTFELDHEAKRVQNRLSLLQTALSDYSKGLDQGQAAALILKFAKISRQRFNEKQFDHVDDLSSFILQLSPGNGHGLYFSGEVWRVRGNREDMRGEFNRYRSVESSLTADQRSGEAELCYQRSDGFCGERTAWIDHIMANDFYRSAFEARDTDAKTAALRSSCQFLKESADHLNQLPLEHFPNGFDASTSFRSTQDLQARVQQGLSSLGAGDSCALPPRPSVPTI